MTNENSKNVNKFIAESGIASRRGADRLIEDRRVKINGNLATLGNRVLPGDRVTVDGKLVKNKETPIYIALNKPVGVVCTTDKTVHNNIIDFINHPKRIFPIGRLDKLSQGLILLTNDGDIVNKILRARNYHEKEYLVKVDHEITEDFLREMRSGVNILDTVTRKCFVKRESDFEFRIILTQGLNRQIRRMCEALGYEVTNLKRLRIVNITLENLPKGRWRNLTEKELKELNYLTTLSTNDYLE